MRSVRLSDCPSSVRPSPFRGVCLYISARADLAVRGIVASIRRCTVMVACMSLVASIVNGLGLDFAFRRHTRIKHARSCRGSGQRSGATILTMGTSVRLVGINRDSRARSTKYIIRIQKHYNGQCILAVAFPFRYFVFSFRFNIYDIPCSFRTPRSSERV